MDVTSFEQPDRVPKRPKPVKPSKAENVQDLYFLRILRARPNSQFSPVQRLNP
jgi:hypothetical protein